MNEQERAQRALFETFHQDQATLEAHPPKKPRKFPGPRTLTWMLAIAGVIFVLLPTTIILIYPRFGPVDTMTSFCTAEEEGKYDTAYGLLSQHVQQHVSLTDFTQASRAANLMTCSPNHGIPFILGGTHSSLDVAYQFFGGSNERDGSMSFIREHGEWRIDSMTPDLFHLSS